MCAACGDAHWSARYRSVVVKPGRSGAEDEVVVMRVLAMACRIRPGGAVRSTLIIWVPAGRCLLLGGPVMTTFGLVHGAFHGSWCWERLTPELERLGHRVLTVDLPSEEPRAGAAE